MSDLADISWGVPQSLLVIYRAVFRGSIDYGSHVFQFRGNKSIFSCLERLQWKAIRIALDYRLSTPINVMLAEACEPPLRIRFNYLASRYLFKNFSKRGSLPINSLEQLETVSITSRSRITACQSIPIFKKYILLKT